ncbi:MAG: hypothetical protein WA137_04000 [Methanothrix sp.]
MQKMKELADRIFCIYSKYVRSSSKPEAKMPEAQRRLWAYSNSVLQPMLMASAQEGFINWHNL